jgi:hypothetical protein
LGNGSQGIALAVKPPFPWLIQRKASPLDKQKGMGRPASNEQPQGGALEGLLGGTKEIGVSMGEVTVFAVLALGLAYLLIIMIIMMMNISIIIHYCKIYNSGHFNHLQCTVQWSLILLGSHHHHHPSPELFIFQN